jgi:hypothetical protein
MNVVISSMQSGGQHLHGQPLLNGSPGMGVNAGMQPVPVDPMQYGALQLIFTPSQKNL